MARFTPFRLVLVAAALSLAAQAQVQLVDPGKANVQVHQPAAKPAASQPLLPASFSGWERQSEQAGKDPAKFDPASAAALKEYGFSGFESTAYSRDGRTMQVRAARFEDAGGAWGAFTFLRQPADVAENVGDAAAARGPSIVFYRGNILVEAQVSDGAAPPIGDLRSLASALPEATGRAKNLPSLPGYLPKQPLIDVRYFTGPVASAIEKFPLTPAEVRWDDGAEAIWAQRPTPNGPADLVLISYPTPQLAAQRLRDVQVALAGQKPGIAQVARRSGPIVVWVSGPIPAAEAQSLASAVDYNAEVTWNEPTFLGKKNNVGNLVVAALALAGIVLLMSLVAGLAFGGLRILIKRLYPDRVFDRSSDIEIIRLHLSE